MRTADNASASLPAGEPLPGGAGPATLPSLPDRESPPQGDGISLAPSAPGQPAPAGPGRGRTGVFLDRLLMGLTLLLALVVASAPARNSDLWMHLAAGRLIAHGTYQFGVDPFTYSGAGLYWVNHSWLYDLVSYALFQSLGGWALVALKAGLLTGLAMILLFLGRPMRMPAEESAGEEGGATAGPWAAVLCVALAILAMGPWTALQPVCVSYLFLGLTLWLLVRTDERLTAAPRPPLRALAAYWPLLVLFVLWVNLDSWFLLGPLTVALYALGAVLDGRADARRFGAAGILGLVLVAGLAACLVNPHHYHAFTLPQHFALAGGAEVLRQDPAFAGAFLSSFEPAFFGPSPGPVAAYSLLVVLGVLSFLANLWVQGPGGRALPSWRLVVWVAFFLFGAWRAWAIPFFAVATAPILALNIQELVLRLHARLGRPALHRPVAARVPLVLAALVLVAAAWPGWVQGRPAGPPRWAVLADPSYQKAAEQVARWRQDPRLATLGRGLNLSTQAANYFAWFAPGEQSFFDSRLFGNAREWLQLRQDFLGGKKAPGPGKVESGWTALFRKYGIDHVILDDASNPRTRAALERLVTGESARGESGRQSLDAALERLATGSDEWALVYLGGHTLIFGWQDKDHGGDSPYASLRLNLDQRAFRPASDAEALAKGPARGPEAAPWWHSFRKSAPVSSFDRDEALVYNTLFELSHSSQAKRNQEQTRWTWWLSQTAGLVAAPALFGGTATALAAGLRGELLLTRPDRTSRLGPFVVHWFQAHSLRQDDSPPGLPLLAIRAARRAIRANPDDARAYFVLAEAYLHQRNTAERAWYANPFASGAPFTLLEEVRKIQILCALNQALALRPDLAEAHLHLHLMYASMNCLDLAQQHLHDYIAALRAAGPRAGESPEEFAERLVQLEAEENARAAQLKQVLDSFEVNALNLPAGLQADKANKKGLPGKALEILLGSDVTDFGANGARLELDLFLKTGHLKEVREWLEPEHKDLLGRELYYLVATQAAAAAGDYRSADRNLDELIHPPLGPAALASIAVADMVLSGSTRHQTIAAPFVDHYFTQLKAELMPELGRQMGAEVDGAVLRGLLALESGDTDHAAQYLEEALAHGPEVFYTGRGTAERALRLLRANRDQK